MKSKIKFILIAVAVVALLGVLGFEIYVYDQDRKTQQVYYDEILSRVEVYEDEKTSLQTELARLKSNITYTSDTAKIMMGFVLSGREDVQNIREWSNTYDFEPIVILDCSMEYDSLILMIDAMAAEGWEIMLTASYFSDNSNETVLSVMSYLNSMKKEPAEVFLLRNDFFSSANIEILLADGFTGYTVYSESVPRDGQNNDGTVYFEYFYLESNSSTVSSKLKYLYSEKSSMIIAVDMAAVNNGTVSETYLSDLMETTKTYADSDACRYATVTEVVEELSQINEIEEENMENYEADAEEIQDRIEEINGMIREIWNDD